MEWTPLKLNSEIQEITNRWANCYVDYMLCALQEWRVL